LVLSQASPLSISKRWNLQHLLWRTAPTISCEEGNWFCRCVSGLLSSIVCDGMLIFRHPHSMPLSQPPHDQAERSATRSRAHANLPMRTEKRPAKHLQNDLASRSHEQTSRLPQPRAYSLPTLVPRDHLQMHDAPLARRKIREVVSGKCQVDLDQVRRWLWRRGRTSLSFRVESLARRLRSMIDNVLV
jgi:hypothetical protein